VIAACFEYVVKIHGLRGAGQDRAAVFERDGGVVVALADGAGGTSNGEIAAQAIVDTAETLHFADADWSIVLRQVDGDAHRLDGGQSTAVIVTVTQDGIRGASVGDSGAWLIRSDGKAEDLTYQQQAKPLVGAGAHPVATIGGPIGDGTLLVASDGLLRYAKPADIVRVASGKDLAAAADGLLALVRDDAGRQSDDVSIVLVRMLVV
jgi:serine/threonine protein phosphatase PrpC